MSPETLAKALQVPLVRATQWADPLSAAMALHAIDSPLRQAAFIAQCGHECGRFQWLRELWGPTPAQKLYEPVTSKSKDLGNTQPGDGYRYRGGGLIQITGRYNYRVVGQKIGVDLEGSPELIADPSTAALAAARFWTDHNFNAYADAGEFLTLTRALNLGNPHSTAMPEGWADREQLYASCKQALGIES